MSKYIKETVVKDYVWDLLNDCGHGGLTPEDIDEQVTRCVEYMLLEKDCVEIVRCKDCKHWGGVIFGNKCTMLSGLDYVLATKENDFCSYGEQTESEV